MTEHHEYKSVKLLFGTWQALTRICAATGEPRTRALERIVKTEEARMEAKKQKGNNE